MKEKEQSSSEGFVFDKDTFRLIIKAIPTNVFFKDTQGKFRMVSDIYKKDIIELTGENAIGKTSLETHKNRKYGKYSHAQDMNVMSSLSEMRELKELNLGNKKGYFDVRKNPVLDEDGSVLGISGVVYDLTALKQMEAQLHIQSITDGLTGLYNRTYYYERLKSIITEENLPLSIILGDSNGLKLVNDTFGHGHGDRLLMETADILKNASEDSDEIFRIGGDEFVMLCPRTTPERCINILKSIRELESEKKQSTIPVNISCGYATITSVTASFSDAFSLAEKMMYSRKQLESKRYIELINRTPD